MKSGALLDKDGYPTDKALKIIKEWDILKDGADTLLEFIEEIWWAADWGWKEVRGKDILGKRCRRFHISTGGWSGNEDIIEALQENLFWSCYWVQSRRGGHYIFELSYKGQDVHHLRG